MARGFYYTLTLADQFSRTFESWDKGLQNAVRNTDTSAARMERAAGRMAAGFGIALMASVPAMAASFIPLDDALARLETVSTTTFGSMTAAMEKAKMEAVDWSSKHVQGATEMIRAQTELATANLNTEESMAGVAAAAVLATATGDGLAEVAQFLASLYNTLGETGRGSEGFEEFFDKTADSAAEAIKRFQMQLGPLRQGMSFVVAQMAQAGLTGTESAAEAFTALGILNTAGLRAGVAGAALQNVFMKMDEAVEKLGLDTSKFVDKFGEMTNLGDFVDELAMKLETGRTAFDQMNKANEVFGIRGAKAAMILVQQKEAFEQQTEAVKNAKGVAAQLQAVMERTTGSQLKIAANNAVNFAQAVGNSLAPAFISIMKVMQDAFGTLGKWANMVGAMAPAIIMLTGAVVTATAALGGLKVMGALTGASMVAVNASMIAFGKTLLMMSVWGAVAFGALSVLSVLLSSGENLRPRILDGLGESAFRPATDSIRDLTKRWSELDDMARKGIPAPKIVAAESSVKVDTAISVSGAAQAMGMTKEAADRLSQAVVGAIGRMRELGMSAEDAAISTRGAVAGMLGGGLDNDVAASLQKVNGNLKMAETNFLSMAKAAGISGETASQVIASMRKELDIGLGTGSKTTIFGTLRTEDLVAKSKNIEGFGKEGQKAFREYSEAAALAAQTTMLAIEQVEAVSPALAGSLKKSLEGIDFNSEDFLGQTFMRDVDGKLERIGEGWGKFGRLFSNDVNTNITALEVLSTAMDDFLSGFGKSLDIASKAGGDFALAKGMQDELTKLNSAFIKTENELTEMQKGFNKEMTAGGLDAAIQKSDRMGKMALEMGEVWEEGSKAVQAAMLKVGDSIKGTAEEAQLEGLKKFFDQGIGSAKAAADEAQRTTDILRGLRSVIGGQILDEEALKGGREAIGKALEASLMTGSFQAFSTTLFEGSHASLQQGIIQGVQDGLLAASGLAELFKPTKIAERIRDAMAQAADPATGIQDPEKVRDNVRSVIESLKVDFANAKETLKPLFDAIFEVTGSTNLDIFGEAFSTSKAAAIEEMTSALRQQEQAVGSLRASLFTATEAEKAFIDAQITLQRNQGQVLGQDVGSLDISGKISLIQGLITRAQDAGLGGQVRSLTDLLAKQFEALEKAGNISKTGGFSAEEMNKIAESATEVSDALSQPVGMREDVAFITKELLSGKAAAEGLRDALASIGIGGGSLMPSSITVSGATGTSGQINVDFGSTQIVIEAGVAVTESDLDNLRKRLDEEWNKKREDLVQMIRLGGPR